MTDFGHLDFYSITTTLKTNKLQTGFISFKIRVRKRYTKLIKRDQNGPNKHPCKPNKKDMDQLQSETQVEGPKRETT